MLSLGNNENDAISRLLDTWKKREIRVQFVQFSLLMKTINSNDDYKDLFWRNRRESAQF